MTIIMQAAAQLRVKIDPLTLLRVAPFMATADIRYYLNGIMVRKAPGELGGVFVVATNGRCMAIVHDKAGSIDGLAEGSDHVVISIKPPVLVAAKAAISVNRVRAPGGQESSGYAWILVEGTRLSINAGFGQAGGALEEYVAPGNAIIVGKYPDIQFVMPSDFSKLVPNTCAPINASYLVAMSKILATLNNKVRGRATVLWTEPEGPEGSDSRERVYVQVQAIPEFLGIIMGMRADVTDIKALRDAGAVFDNTKKVKA